MKLTQFTKRKDRKKQLAKLMLHMSHIIWPKFLDRHGVVLLENYSVDRRRLLISAIFYLYKDPVDIQLNRSMTTSDKETFTG